jgi:hypothetical protein
MSKAKPPPLSPEKYMLTRARMLPLRDCIINEDWERIAMYTIIEQPTDWEDIEDA